MDKFSAILTQTIKFSNSATSNYQFLKIAMTLDDISDNSLAFTNSELEHAFQKFTDTVSKIEDIITDSPEGLVESDPSQDPEGEISQLAADLGYYANAIKEIGMSKMTEEDWEDEFVSQGELIDFMMNAGVAIDDAITTFSGVGLSDIMDEAKAEKANEIAEMTNRIGHEDQNVTWTGNLVEQRRKANQKYINKIQFGKKINSPEYLRWKKSYEESLERRANRLLTDPEFAEKTKKKRTESYLKRRELGKQRIAQWEKDLEGYSSPEVKKKIREQIERERVVIGLTMNEGAKQYQEKLKDMTDDVDSLIGTLRKFNLEYNALKKSLLSQLAAEFSKDPTLYQEFYKEVDDAFIANDRVVTPEFKAEMVKIKKKIKDAAKADAESHPDYQALPKVIDDLKTYSNHVKTVNNRGNAIQARHVQLALNTINEGNDLISKYQSKYQPVVRWIPALNYLLDQKIKGFEGKAPTVADADESNRIRKISRRLRKLKLTKLAEDNVALKQLTEKLIESAVNEAMLELVGKDEDTNIEYS